jgi:predicted phage terminase large subunit-like protein
VHYAAIAEEDELYRKKGEALHPERYDIKKLTQIKRNMAPADWEALYQQNPTMADGDYFTTDMFREYLPKDRPSLSSLAIYQTWDLAIGTKETNDYSVGTTIGIDENDNHYVLDVARGRWGAFELVEKIIELATTYKPMKVGIETSQIEMALGPLLAKRMREKKAFFPIERLKPGRRDKMLRARSLQGRMQQGMVLFDKKAPYFQTLQNEMLAFPAGKHDDMVDSISWLYLMLDSMVTPYVPTPKPKKGWRDKLSKLTRKTTAHTAMGA